MPDPGGLEQLQSCDDPAFHELYEIYDEAIEARERKPERWICKMVRSPSYRVWLMRSAGRVAGFSIFFMPADGSFALLEYMAVSAEQRNHGIGSTLFTQSVRAIQPRNAPHLPVVLEVDSPREASADRDMRTRRQHFYRRLGCRRVAGLHYILPLPGLENPPEMDLMVHATPLLPSVAKSQLEGWLTTMYRDVYHAPPDDPRVARMLSDLPDPVPLE